MENTPAQAWFSPPEGVYTLIQSLNVTTSSTAHFVSNAATPAPPAAQPGATSNDPMVLPPPPHPTKMATATVTFPRVREQQGVSGLGMSMGSLRATGGGGGERTGLGPIRRGSSTAESSPMLSGGLSTLGAEGVDPVPIGGGGRTNGGSTSTPTPPGGMHGSFSPLLKRRPLTSSFSIPTLGSLGAGNGGSSGGSAGEAGVMTSRPIRQFRGTSSSFVRSWEGLPLSQGQLKGIAEGNSGRQTVFGFYTSGKSVVWVEIGQGRPKEALARVVFNVFPTCIDVNQHTMSHSQIDVLVGFLNGDIFWFDPLTAKYTRLNKSGIIASSPITSLSWLPPSPTHAPNENHSNLFLTSHADGTMLVWDKDREDWSGFTPTPVPTGINLRNPSLGGGKENDWGSSTNGESSYTGSDRKHAPMSTVSLPAGMSDLVVSRPAAVDKKGGATTKFNPVSHWRLSKKAITAFAFSPDLQLCAAVGEDGCLRIINAAEEKLLDTFAGYFGSLSCVAWSPDGRFVVTGGQDDLCTIYSPLEQRIVARCQGHSSWVTGVAWDPWRSDERTMRFASVGEDCKLILWDLSSAALTRPKAHAHIHHRRHSLSSQRESVSHLPLSAAERTEPIFHPSPRRDDVAMLQPIMVKTLSADLFSGLTILPDALIILSRSGQIKMFDRPPEAEDGSGLLGLSHEFAGSVVALDRRAR